MKKLMFYAMSVCMSLLFIPTQLSAENETRQVAVATTSIDATVVVEAQMARLVEISEMDMSTLSRSEKNDLRAEVRAIKSDFDELTNKNVTATANYVGGGGIYISVGAAILILILLILLL